jgi:hypothetical protein
MPEWLEAQGLSCLQQSLCDYVRNYNGREESKHEESYEVWHHLDVVGVFDRCDTSSQYGCTRFKRCRVKGAHGQNFCKRSWGEGKSLGLRRLCWIRLGNCGQQHQENSLTSVFVGLETLRWQYFRGLNGFREDIPSKPEASGYRLPIRRNPGLQYV